MVCTSPACIRALPLLVVLVGALGASPALAQRSLPLTVPEVAGEAGAVVLARVLSVQVRREGNIFTFVDFQTTQAAKGTMPDRFTFRMLGGRLGDVVLDGDPPNPTFTPGEEVVLFIGQQRSLDGYPTIYFDHVYRVTATPAGEKMVRRDWREPGPSGLLGPSMRLSDFVASLRNAK
jgi:hypothetical protein